MMTKNKGESNISPLFFIRLSAYKHFVNLYLTK